MKTLDFLSNCREMGDRGVHVFSLKCLLINGQDVKTFLVSQILKVNLVDGPISQQVKRFSPNLIRARGAQGRTRISLLSTRSKHGRLSAR